MSSGSVFEIKRKDIKIPSDLVKILSPGVISKRERESGKEEAPKEKENLNPAEALSLSLIFVVVAQEASAEARLLHATSLSLSLLPLSREIDFRAFEAFWR